MLKTMKCLRKNTIMKIHPYFDYLQVFMFLTYRASAPPSLIFIKIVIAHEHNILSQRFRKSFKVLIKSFKIWWYFTHLGSSLQHKIWICNMKFLEKCTPVQNTWPYTMNQSMKQQMNPWFNQLYWVKQWNTG